MLAKVAVLVFSYYPEDVRPRREAEALIKEKMSVDVICLRGVSEPKKEIVNGVHVYRIPLKRSRGGKLRYLCEYACFIIMSFFTLSFLYIQKRYSMIHVHNMPDILVLSSLLPRLFGSKIILDLHDPMPEVFLAKYNMKDTNLIVRLLRFLEKFSIRFSDLVLTPNTAFRDLFISRGCPESKIHIVMNSPQESIFSKSNLKMGRSFNNSSKFIVMYHGSITERNGIDVALKALSDVRHKIPNIVFHVYGGGDFLDRFKNLVFKLGAEDIVKYHGLVPQEKIAFAIHSAHLGLIPNRPSIHWELALPTRIFEYLSLEKAVIAPRTKGIQDYFDDESLYFFEPGDAESLAETIFKVYCNPERRNSIVSRGIKVYKKYRWELQRQYFIGLVIKLLGITTHQTK